MANTYLSRVHGSSTNTKQWTVSLWVKRAKIGYQCSIWGTGNSSGYYTTFLMFSSDDTLRWGNLGGSSMEGELITNRKFKDTNSWYHIVVGVDTDQSTASNRVKIYVNGVQETSFSTNNQPSQGQGLRWNEATSTSGPSIGRTGHWDARYFEGCMSHIHLIDGTQYAASDFGSTDSTTGEWKINTNPNVTYGTNGAFILKDGNSGTDESPNSNTWTANGTLTKTEDNPSNIFATWNPLVPTGGGFQGNSSTHRYGGNDFVTNNSSSNYGTTWSTLGMTTGKYYMEIHYESSSNQGIVGIIGHYPTSTANYIGGHANSYGIYTDGNKYNSGSSSSYGVSWTNGDYLGIFLDLDNNKLYFSKNGTVMNSGTGIDITAASSTEMGAYHFACMEYNSSGNGDFAANFGNGIFRVTALTGTTYDGADGNGIFKYEPTGLTLDSSTKSFKSLSTKGLNS